MDVKEVANGVVHPTTKKTIIAYQTLIDDPLLHAVWTRAMCKELGRLAQGYKDTKNTNMIKFTSLEKISQIPKDRTVTYACIVVDYLEQKLNPNCVRITVEGI